MVGMEFSHVCLVYVMPWHIVAIAVDFLRGDAPGGLWSPHSLNRHIVVLVIRAHFDGNEVVLPRCAGYGVADFFLPEPVFCGSGKFPKRPGALSGVRRVVR